MQSKGFLEYTTPQTLLDTVVFYNKLFYCIEEWEGPLTAENIVLPNTSNRTSRRGALSLLHISHLKSLRRPKRKT